jgi:hypothetical protein
MHVHTHQSNGVKARSKVLGVDIPAKALKAIGVSIDMVKGQRR